MPLPSGVPVPRERESPEQAARREGGRLFAWFVACAAVVSLLIMLVPLSTDVPAGPPAGERGHRLLDQSAPAGPLPATPIGRSGDPPANEATWPSIV